MDVPAPPAPPSPVLMCNIPRVLAVDGDAAHLQTLEKLLRKCSYEGTEYGAHSWTQSAEPISFLGKFLSTVTTCCHPSMAMEMLRANRGKFDAVLTDVFGPGLDGLEFLESVCSDMGLPIVVILVDDKIDAAAAAMKEKACGYLTKPCSIEELKSTLQRILECKPRVSLNSDSSTSSTTTTATMSTSKRKDIKGKAALKHDEVEQEQPETNVKKPRVVWTRELHKIFVAAVDKLQENAVPKKILGEMNVPELTRENVASHLQKYRVALKEAQEKIKIQQLSASRVVLETVLRPPPRQVQAPLLLSNWHRQQQMPVFHWPLVRSCNNILASDHGHHHRFNGTLVQPHLQRILLQTQVRTVQQPSAAYLSNNGGFPAASYSTPIGNPNLSNGQMVLDDGQMLFGGQMGENFGGDMQNHPPNWPQMRPFELAANISQECLAPEVYGRDQTRESYMVHQQITTRTQVGHEFVTEPVANSSNSNDTYQELIPSLPNHENDSDSPSWEFGPPPNNFD